MKTSTYLVALVVLSATQAMYVPRVDVPLDDLWELYKKKFNKDYESKEFEITRRLIWEMNYNLINRHNLQNDLGYYSYRLGMNEYSDMTNDEINNRMNGLRFKDYEKYNASMEFVDEDISGLPNEVDWRKEGYVTGVKNQGKCGSCWAFSTTGSLEGQHYKKTGNLVSLSEQDIMDCSNSCGGEGCEGGLMDFAFKCIKKQGGIDSEDSYPYEAKDDKCRFNRTKSVTSVSSYVDIKKFSEKALQKAVATIGPISVAIDASDIAFSQYKEGVYENIFCSSFNLDHGVLVVGYGTSHGNDYWLVKNSWGRSWGLNGYIKMARNNDNMCGIATLASYPIV